MGQPYVGEIRIFAGNFAPVNWMFCQGQLLPISVYDALYALIGTTYGGDGQNTFALPDLRGRVPVHNGAGYVLGQPGGVEQVAITSQQVPAHSHGLTADTAAATGEAPSGALLAAPADMSIYSPATPNLELYPQALLPNSG